MVAKTLIDFRQDGCWRLEVPEKNIGLFEERKERCFDSARAKIFLKFNKKVAEWLETDFCMVK